MRQSDFIPTLDAAGLRLSGSRDAEVDELHLMIGPALLGGGTPPFDGDSRVPLRLLGTRVLDRSHLILAKYAVG